MTDHTRHAAAFYTVAVVDRVVWDRTAGTGSLQSSNDISTAHTSKSVTSVLSHQRNHT